MCMRSAVHSCASQQVVVVVRCQNDAKIMYHITGSKRYAHITLEMVDFVCGSWLLLARCVAIAEGAPSRTHRNVATTPLP
jgi:hypothetical protein